MFDVHMLPAQHGDCLWLEYGDAAAPHRVLIDGGTGGSYPALRSKIEALPADQRRFELFVVTHVDDDHIGGALRLLADAPALGVSFDDLWFNAYPHLEGKAVRTGPDLLGARQGEKLSELIVDAQAPWNRHFDGRAVACEEGAPLPVRTLAGGLRITLLSPYPQQLAKMKTAWIAECRKAKLLPGGGIEEFVIDDTLGDDVDALARLPFEPDTAAANGSSIAFLAEADGCRVLFGADAHAPVLVRSLAALGHDAEHPLELAAMKAPHHGSSHNTNRELLQLAPARQLLISTNGDKFQHPDRTAVARMVRFNTAPDAALCFNYATEFNRFWGQRARQERYGYRAVYPEEGDEGLRVRLA
jgi:beta-lactamase superfamily II metal-dependent hydrolase